MWQGYLPHHRTLDYSTLESLGHPQAPIKFFGDNEITIGILRVCVASIDDDDGWSLL